MKELKILREARAIIGNSNYPEKERIKLYIALEKFIASKEETSENKEFSKMIEEETEQNVKHIQTMISEDDKK